MAGVGVGVGVGEEFCIPSANDRLESSMRLATMVAVFTEAKIHESQRHSGTFYERVLTLASTKKSHTKG